MLISRLLALMAIVAIAAILPACDSPFVEDFKSIFDAVEAISVVAETDQVDITISNGSEMSVTIGNSPLNNVSAKERETAAERIALIAFSSYAHPEGLRVVRLTFVVVEKKYLVVTYQQMVESFSYSRDRLVEFQSHDQ